MNDPEFAGSSYPTRDAMLDAIADAWLWAGGHNSRDDVHGALATFTDAELAEATIENWSLDQAPVAAGGQEILPSDMARFDYDAEMLAAAFGRVRATVLAEAAS